MNMTELVESGKYPRSGLKPMQEEFVSGMEWVMDEIVDNEAENYIFENGEPGLDTHNALLGERVRDFSEFLKSRIYAGMCDMIVSMLDSNASEEDDG